MNRNTGIIAIIIILVAAVAYIGFKPQPVEPETTETSQTPTEPEQPDETEAPEETTTPVDDPPKDPEPPKEPEKTAEQSTYTVSDLYIVNINTEDIHETQVRATITNFLDQPQTISLPVTVDDEKHKVSFELGSNQTLFTESLRFYPPGEYNLTVGDAWITFDTYCHDSRYTLNSIDLTQGIPQFVTHDYTSLDYILAVSKFRSSAGHSFTDELETCRSMKHYYEPKPGYLENGVIPAYSPIDGRIVEIKEGHRWPGAETDYSFIIQSEEYSGIHFNLFHIDKHDNYTLGSKVNAGDYLGTFRLYYPSSDEYAGDFDIAVGANTPEGYRYISFFETMVPDLLATYEAKGATLADLVITKEQRDADPLECNGESFTTYDESDWVTLD